MKTHSRLLTSLTLVALALPCIGAGPAQPKKPVKPAQTSAKSPAAKQAAPRTGKVTKTQKKPAVKADPKPAKMPKLLDLGADKCIPCKMMKPVLEDLKKEYNGKLEVIFIDVWENRKAAEDYKIQSIPTQIFYDANGKELSRHVGFISKKDILAQFKEHNINITK